MKITSDFANLTEDFLRNQRVRLNYQPVVDFLKHEVFCLEALLHWPSLNEMHISNEGFMAELEKRPDLNRILDSYVVTHAANDWHHLQIEHGYKGMVSVNVSPSSLQDKQFIDHIKSLIMFGSEQGAPPIQADKLILEITERQRWKNPERILTHIKELNTLGVQFAVDDFITDYANFNVILNDVVSIVKLDKSLTDRIFTDNNVHIFVEQFIELARHLNKTVVVEGIEEYEQADEFSELGYRLFQGYFFTVPTDLDGIVRYLKAQRIYRR